MLLRKDLLYKSVFYFYFLMLPVIAALETFSPGSNKLFNGAFLVILILASIDLYRRSFMDKYIALFFLFALSIFLILSIVYGFGLSSEYNPDIAEGLKLAIRILMIACMTYFAFLLTRYEVLNFKDFTNIAVFLVAIMLLGQLLGLNKAAAVAGVGNEFALQGLTGHVAITSSILLSAIPILLISSEKSKIGLIALVLCAVAILFTFRRSAWLIVAALLIAHIYILYFRSSTDAYRQLKITLLIVAGFVGLGLFLAGNPEIYQSIMLRLQDLNVAQGGTGAGRSVFWAILIDYIVNQPIVNFIFGNGYGFVQGLLETRFGVAIGAHNDWLDLLLAFGVIPIVIFILMIGVLLFQVIKKDYVYKLLLAYCVFSLLALSFTTGGAFDTYFTFLHTTIAFVIATQYNIRENTQAS